MRQARPRARLGAGMLAVVAAMIVGWASAASAGKARLVDSFDTIDGWQVVTSDGAELKLSSDIGYRGRGLRLDFDFHGGGGYVNVQKRFDLPLPENYAFSYRLRGIAPANNFEFKLLDPSGRNVWWHNDRNIQFPRRWDRMRVRKSRLQFAWGPSGGTPLERVGLIEFTIAAGSGGKGSIWIDELEFVPREANGTGNLTPVLSASTEIAGKEAEQAWSGGAGWHSEPVPHPQWLLIDFHGLREYGGLVIQWDDDDYATSYQVLTSDAGRTWTPVRTNTLGNGGRDYIEIPDGESRYIKIELDESSRGTGYGIDAVEVRPFEFSASPSHFFRSIATEAPRGWYPKYLLDEQTYFAVVGTDHDTKEALLNEEGMLEVDESAFSIEPFLVRDGRLITWADTRTITQSLVDGDLPIPTVTWSAPPLSLEITPWVAGPPDASRLYARYRLRNTSDKEVEADLLLALRPFQVNPPWQSMRRPGGVAPLRHVRIIGDRIEVDEQRRVELLTPPAAAGAMSFADGSLGEVLTQGRLPTATDVTDGTGYASAIARYPLRLGAKESLDVHVAVPLHPATPDLPSDTNERQHAIVQAYDTAVADWRRLLARVQFHIPEPDAAMARAARTIMGHVLINRDGAAIHPGSRSYARSWIRDGAVTASALLKTGFAREAADFVRWYAAFQYPNGKIPCCVDDRGRDPVPEHDSHGQFIFAIAETYRFTRDIGLVSDLWPNVTRAVAYIEELRAQRSTPRYDEPDRILFRGLLPESISHEGYSSQPVHSYWDDLWALRGLRDAAFLARVMGDAEHAAKIQAAEDDLRRDLRASIERSIAKHGIDFIPGAAELGDFDANSTAIAFTPIGEAKHLPQPELVRTFERYYEIFQQRQAGTLDWQTYTPYEVRNAPALLRLGHPDRALEILRGLFAAQRPPAWHQWQEIVWRDPQAPRFIGDMPHTWIGAAFVRALRTLFAYEDEASDALILGAGLPAAWIDAAEGTGVERLPTYYGILGMHVQRLDAERIRVRLNGDLHPPKGKLQLRLPSARPLRGVRIDGEPSRDFDETTAFVGRVPAEVVLSY